MKFLDSEMPIEDFLDYDPHLLSKEEEKLEKLLKDVEEKAPTREEAFQMALGIERAHIEREYYKGLNSPNGKVNPKIIETLRTLDGETILHIKRIEDYMRL